MMLHQPRDIGVVFQYKYGLAQNSPPRPPAVDFLPAKAARNYEQSNAIRQIDCKRCVNLSGKGSLQPTFLPAATFS
jgi:hypothetical protein